MGGDGRRNKYLFWQYTKPTCNTSFIHIGYASRTQMPWLPWDREPLQWKALEGKGVWLRYQDGQRRQLNSSQWARITCCCLSSWQELALSSRTKSVFVHQLLKCVFQGGGIVYISSTYIHIYLWRCIYIYVLVQVLFTQWKENYLLLLHRI